MNEVLKQIHAHRSIRKFKMKGIEEKVLKEILEAATMASSSGNMQAYSIIVTKEKKMKEKMFEAHFEQSMLMDAPVFLTFCADFHRMRRWVEVSEAKNNFDNFMSFMIASIDAVLASQNAALAAESLGLGLCYMGTTLASAGQIGEILELPKHVIPVVGFALGYPDEKPEMRKRLPMNGIIHEEKYTSYSNEKVQKIYQEKEATGMRRYLNQPALAQRIKMGRKLNLAQIYTELKYTEETHVKYSDDLLEYLFYQDFLKKELGNFTGKTG